MPSTYTLNNGIELIGDGEQSGTWGDTTNTNLSLIDTSLDGHVTITLSNAGTSGSPNNLPITDGTASNGRNRALIFTDGADLGADAYVQLTPNDAKKILFVRNSLNGSRNLILFQGTYNASNDFVLAAGKDAIVKFDGAGSGAVASAVLADFALDAATITTISNTTLNTTTVNATTVDTTNLEVTNLKAKDGSNAGSIADSTGVVTLASSVLTTTDINGGTIDGVTIGGASAGAGTFTNLTASGAISFAGATTANGGTVTTIDINGGTIDNTVIGGASANAGTFTTLNASSGTFSGNVVLGDAATDTVTVNADVASDLIPSADGTYDLGAVGSEWQDLFVDGTANIDSLVADTADINGGTIDGTVIGGTTPAAISGTTGTFSGNVTIADKIIHSGDTNTSIRFPAADTFTVETAGSERLRVDSSGNVGIGTTSPAQALDVTGNAAVSGNVNIVENGNPLRFTGTTTGNTGGMEFYTSDVEVASIGVTGTTGAIILEADPNNTEGNSSIQFDVDGSERMRIDNNGNVGIGTTSPAQALDVTGNAAVSGRIKIGDGADSVANGDELVLSKDQTNVGMSLLAADGTGFVRFFLGSQTDTTAAKIQHQENNDRLILQSAGDLYFQTGGTNTTMTLNTSGDLDVTGALSKGSGSFKIDHPLKPGTHHLVHSFIEGPQADNLYRGRVDLVGGTATVNLDTAGRMTEGTFVALNGNVQCFTSNEQGWTAVRGSVSGNVLTIEAQDATCTDTVSWMVIGERKDQHMIDTHWTDAAGRVITEPEKTKDQQEDDA